MNLFHFRTGIILLVVCWYADIVSGQKLGESIPSGRRCRLKYGEVINKSPWICKDKQFQNYPTKEIEALLGSPSQDMDEFLKITKSCYSVKDIGDIRGKTEYYMHKSLCRTIREPIKVLWAEVPGYALKGDEIHLNGGLLPVNVVAGQSFYDVRCEHPLASAPKEKLNRQQKGTKWSKVKHFCWIGYSHKRNFFCKQSGFINREILVYSRHAHLLFYLSVPNVPTSCACTFCSCKPRRRRVFG